MHLATMDEQPLVAPFQLDQVLPNVALILPNQK